MSARGAADFLTRATAILATLFVVLSIALAGLATIERAPMKIDPSLSKTAPRPAPIAPGVPPSVDPLAAPGAQAPAPAAVPAGNGSVPAGR
jgi:preprotein translocase subunit SecG